MVLFLDSGIGGLSYLEEFHRRQPDVPLTYLADSQFFPYGNRAPAVVKERVLSLVHRVQQIMELQAVVIACNTASVVALEAVRRSVTVPVVGVVPAVKPAAERTRTGHIALLATANTAKDPYTDGLVNQFARYCRVTRLGLPELVLAAEFNLCGEQSPTVTEVITTRVKGLLAADVDTVVLACTHFVRYRQEISRALQDRAVVIDSLDGVVKRLEWIVSSNRLVPERLEGVSPSEVPPRMFSTSPPAPHLHCLKMQLLQVPL